MVHLPTSIAKLVYFPLKTEGSAVFFALSNCMVNLLKQLLVSAQKLSPLYLGHQRAVVAKRHFAIAVAVPISWLNGWTNPRLITRTTNRIQLTASTRSKFMMKTFVRNTLRLFGTDSYAAKISYRSRSKELSKLPFSLANC